jgi:hypothetical protein
VTASSDGPASVGAEEVPADFAALQRTPHELTLDFVRVGPGGQFGTVVSRINFSPLLLAELRDLFNSAWEQYTRDAGMPQEADES